jgi:predicted phage terminase large subunit-like protein
VGGSKIWKMEVPENKSPSSPPGTGSGLPSGSRSPSTPSPDLLTDEELQYLTLEELTQYREIIERAEREEDLENVANGLTLDLADFQRQAWAIVEPETPLVWNWFQDYLCDWLTLIADGRFKQMYPEKLGIIINQPPRSGKSTFASVNWPVWTWARFPSRRFLCGSHSLPLAALHNSKRNRLVASPWYQERFGNRFKLTAVGAHVTQNDRTGRFQVASIGSKQTGFGGMILIGDDLLDREDAFSDAVKKKTNSWIDSSFSKMLDDAVRGVTVHISQRLATNDPTGHLLGEDRSTGKPSDWVHIKIRREATQPEEYIFPISGRVVTRNKGDILEPQRCPPMVLLRLKSKSREWANQEQQEPTPETGAIINPNWMKYYQAGEALPSFFQVIVSIDCTFKDGDGTDMVALHKYGLAAKRRILLDRRTERLNYPSTKQAAKEMARGGHKVQWLRDPMPAATQLLVENKANGPALTQELRDDPEFPLAVLEYEPGRSSKTERFVTASSDVEAGLCWFPIDAPWIGELRKTLCDYAGEGSVAFDDDCDAFSQFVNWSRQSQYGYLAYLDKMAAQQEPTTHRFEYENEHGQTVVLEWDEARRLWCGPNGEEFPEAEPEVKPEDAATAERQLGDRATGEGAA